MTGPPPALGRRSAKREGWPRSVEDLQRLLADQQYIADRGLAISLYLGLRLGRPVFLEGEAGVGKTEVGKVLAAGLGVELIRLQCYEGLDVSHAVYEWNYPRQILEIRTQEATGASGLSSKTLFTEEFLIKRALLRALEAPRGAAPLLLIDEIDRADEEFEGFLLEMLSDFQVTIPELGTIRADEPPIVIITSNRTREVHDALKRRCLYFWIDYPDFEKEVRIITTRVPEAPRALAEEVAAFVRELRASDLLKPSGVSETLDWIAALMALDQTELDAQVVSDTLGILLKQQEDIQAIRGDRLDLLLGRARARGARQSG
jgi:MoxR-like ATPase